MWTERPKVWTDGLIMATTVGLAMGLIVSIGSESDPTPAQLPSCQEVVVMVHPGEEVLAQCPQGTWLDIVDGVNVVCRCQAPREPRFFERSPGPSDVPPPIRRIPQADPPLKDDKRGTEI